MVTRRTSSPVFVRAILSALTRSESRRGRHRDHPVAALEPRIVISSRNQRALASRRRKVAVIDREPLLPLPDAHSCWCRPISSLEPAISNMCTRCGIHHALILILAIRNLPSAMARSVERCLRGLVEAPGVVPAAAIRRILEHPGSGCSTSQVELSRRESRVFQCVVAIGFHH